MRYILSLLLLGLLRMVNPDRTAPLLENLALRQQLAALNRKAARPRLAPFDRVFWALLASRWSDWRGALVMVKPATVIGWHRKGFRLFWT